MRTPASGTQIETGRPHLPAELTARQVFFAFAALFLLNLLLRVFYLRYDFVNGDEGVRALTATQMLNGARLYADVVTDKPPGATLFYATVFALFGRSMKAVHLAAAVWNFATAVVIYRLIGRVWGQRIALWAALFFVYFTTNYFTQDTMAANTELLLTLPYTLAFAWFIRGFGLTSNRPAARRALLLAGAGAMSGFAALFKQIAVLNLLYFCVFEVVFTILNAPGGFKVTAASITRSVRMSLERLTFVALGFALVIAAFVAWLASLGALADFWRNGVEINMFYIDSEPAALWLRFFVGRGLGYVLFNFVLWALAGWTVVRSLRSAREAGEAAEAAQRESLSPSRFSLAVALWCVVSLISVVLSGRFFGHYFITALPALAMLAAPSLIRLRGMLSEPAERNRARAVAAILSICFMVGLARSHSRTVVLAFETITGSRTRWSATWGMTKRQDEAAVIASRLRSELGPGEPLYIWGYAHDIYWQTGCSPAARYLTPYYIDGRFADAETVAAEPNAPFWQEARANLVADLERTRPRVILDVAGNMGDLPYPRITDFLKENYHNEGNLGSDPNRPFTMLKRNR